MAIQDFTQAMPLLSIIIFSFVITLALTFVYKFLTKQEDIKNLKARVKELQQQMKEEKDQNKLMDLQKEMMKLSMEQMKHTMKPMLFTFLPLILVFMALRKLYVGTGYLIPWNVNLPIVGTGAGWFLSYVIFSFAFSMILRKILKVH